MKRVITQSILMLSLFLCALPNALKAQTFEVAGGSTTTGSHLNTLLYTWYQAPRTQRMATLYPASQIAAGAMTAGALISSLELQRTDASGASYPAGTCTVKIYLENRASTTVDLGAGNMDWASNITNATLVFDGDVGAVLGTTAGWKNFTFGTGTGAAAGFTYTGGALVVYADYAHTAAVGASGIGNYVNMAFATNTNGTPAPNGWVTNSTKASNTSTTTPPTTMGGSGSSHPHIRFNYSGATVCTAPPPVGTATASVTSACQLTPITLNVTGITPGSGQTFKWQSASSIGGTYSDISTDDINSALVVTPSVTTYYRAVVTCSGQSTESTPVGVTIDMGLAAGTYTINSALATGGTNYQTFAAAIAAMSCGIQGPVVFNVDAASGPYNEQLIIPQIVNSSSVNTITFNGNGRRLQAAPVSATRAMIRLDGADYVTINNLDILTQDATYGWGVHFTNLAENNRVTNCTIDVSAVTSVTQANSAAIVASGSNTSVTSTGNVAHNNTISGNTLIGGYQGIIMHGISATRSTGNTIINNTVRDFYGTGIELSYHTGTIISGNDISRGNRTSVTTFAGVELGTSNNSIEVNANRIHNTHNPAATQGGTSYGVYLNSCDADGGTENFVTNNLIYDFNCVPVPLLKS